MPEEKCGKNAYGQIGLTALCAAGLVCALYWLKGFFPFGDGSVMMIDLYSQYLPLLYRFYDVVGGQKNLFLELSAAGGINLYAETINEVCNPFNYVLFLFGRGMIWQSVNVLLLLYLVCASASAHFFLLRVWPRDRRWNTVLSLCYGLSAYGAYQFQIIKWMIFPVIFPFFVLSLKRLLLRRKGGLYALLLAWQMVLSIQLGFMALCFTLFSCGIWFWTKGGAEPENGKSPESTGSWRRLWQRLSSGRQEACILGIYTLAGLFLAGFVLAPELLILLSSARAGENLTYWEITGRYGLDDLFERLFEISHPALLALLAGLAVKKRLRIRAGGAAAGGAAEVAAGGAANGGPLRFWLLLNGFLWLTVLLQPANLLWHLGSYVCFPVRYAYMVLLAQTGLAKALMESAGEDKKTGSIRPAQLAGVLAALACILLAFCCVMGWEEKLVQAFSSLAISSSCPKETLQVCLILALFFLAALIGFFCGPFAKPAVLATAASCSLCLFVMICLPEGNAVRTEDERAYQVMEQRYRETGQAPELRVQEAESLPFNFPLVEGTNSLNGYFSTVDKAFQRAMGELGYLTPWVSVRSTGTVDTAASDALLWNRERENARPLQGTVFYTEKGKPELAGETAEERQEALGRWLAETRTELTMPVLDSRGGRISAEVTAREDGFLFLPFAALPGWQVERNGEKAKVEPLLGGFLGVALQKGENRIVLRFREPGLAAGMALTVLGLLLLLAAGRLKDIAVVKNMVGGAYTPLLAAGVLFFYVLPMLGLALHLAQKVLERLGVGG